MSIDTLRVSFKLDQIHCADEGDGPGNAEPFLWVVFFKVDGDTVFIGDDLKLHGSATVVGTPGSHGDLPGNVAAGDTIAIPPSLGSFTTTLRPIPAPFGKSVGGIAGMLAILLEEDSTSDADIAVGHAALNAAVQQGIDKLIHTLGVAKQTVTSDDLAMLEASIASSVETAIKNEVDLFQGLWSYIGFGNGQDDKIGTARYVGKYLELAKSVGSTLPLSWSWPTEGSWSMTGSLTVHKPAAAAIMRGGDWASSFQFGKTTAQLVATNQTLFDKQGLRLLQLDTWLDGSTRRWSSIHRAGNWAHQLRIDRDTKTFLAETQELFDHHGLRLENMVTYLDAGVRRWAGSYRSGDWAHHVSVGLDGPAFAKHTQDVFEKQGLRLEQMVTYVDAGVRHWGGIYRSGDWASRFTMDRDTKTFLDETQHWFDKDGLRLASFVRYDVNGVTRWGGVYRSSDWSHRLVIDRGFESLIAETQDAFNTKGQRVVCVDVYDAPL
jgi:hypothetical protein